MDSNDGKQRKTAIKASWHRIFEPTSDTFFLKRIPSVIIYTHLSASILDGSPPRCIKQTRRRLVPMIRFFILQNKAGKTRLSKVWILC